MNRRLILSLALVAGCQKTPATQPPAAPASPPPNVQQVPASPTPRPSQPATPREDTTLYNGKTVAQWLALLEDSNGFVRLEAIDVLGSRGEAVLPAVMEKFRAGNESAARVLPRLGPKVASLLCDILDDKTPGPRLRAAIVMWEMARFGGLPENAAPSLAAALADMDTNIQTAAAEALSALGPKAKAVGPNITERLKADPTKTLAVAVWKVTGRKDEPLEALTGLATSDRAIKRKWGFEGLAALGADAAAALPTMVAGLKDDDRDARDAAAGALRAVGPAAKAVISELVKALEDGGPGSGALAEALGRFGPDAKTAIPALAKHFHATFDVDKAYGNALVAIGPDSVPEVVKMLSDSYSGRRQSAAELLGRFGAGAKSAVGPLTKRLDDEELVRGAAIDALGQIGPDAKSAVPALKKFVAQPADWLEFVRAVGTLEKIGVDPAEIAPSLTAALKHADETMRQRAADAIGRGAPKTKAAIPALVEALKSGPKGDRTKIMETLRAFGPLAADAAAELIKLLNEEDDSISETAATTLGAVGEADPRVIPALIATLKDRSFTVKIRVADALANFGPKSVEAMPVLLEELKGGHPLFADRYLNALAAIGPDAKASLPVLRERLNMKRDPDPNLEGAFASDRIWTAYAIFRIGGDPEALTFLVEMLKKPYAHTAANALGRIGPAAKVAVPALIKSASDKSPDNFELRAAALDALKRIDPASVPKDE